MAVMDGQIMHGSSRSLLAEKPEGIFRQSQLPVPVGTGSFFCQNQGFPSVALQDFSVPRIVRAAKSHRFVLETVAFGLFGFLKVLRRL